MYTSEEELFKAVINRIDRNATDRDISWIAYAILFKPYIKIKNSIANGKNIYGVGENHFAIEPVYYIHNSIVPLIKDAGNWLFLRESLYDGSNKILFPTDYYVKELALLYNVPILEALGDLNLCVDEFSKEGVSKEIMVKSIFNGYKIIKQSLIDMNSAEFRRIMEDSSVEVVEPDRIYRIWDAFSKKRIENILGERTEKNILFSAGYTHLRILP